MIIMLGCGVLLLVGLAAGCAWGGRTWESPPEDLAPSAGEVARRFTWYVSIMLTGGVFAGATVIGAGGRLAMRLLAATAGSEAQGRTTEAKETVGVISFDGTVGFILFNGVLPGVAAAGIYLLIRRFLPEGWMSGVGFGLGVLIVVGTTVDPLRADNRDFDLVGPGWLAALVFSLVLIGFGVVLAGVTSRMSAWLPLLSKQRTDLVRYLVPAVFAAIAFAITAVLAVLCVAVVAATRWRPLTRAIRSQHLLLATRVILYGGVAVASLNAVSALTDIATR